VYIGIIQKETERKTVELHRCSKSVAISITAANPKEVFETQLIPPVNAVQSFRRTNKDLFPLPSSLQPEPRDHKSLTK
jgi:hypothetical protein